MLKVKIKDFQSIANTEFEIDGFTVIVGSNNRGKSAIVRSIDAALSNRLGNNFIRWGKLQTEVGLTTDSLDISWVKGETASYNINKKPFTSLNRAVPKPISDAGFRKLEIADEKLNPLIAHQFEELFLINKSGPFVTEAISTLYDLNDINDADTLCQKKLRASKSLLKTRQADADALSDKISQFNGLEDVKVKWEEIKGLLKKSDALKKEISDIEEFENQLKDAESKIQKLQTVSKIKVPKIEGPERLINEYQWLNQTIIVFQKSLQLVQRLKAITEIKIPDIEGPKQLITEYQWLESNSHIFQKSLQLVQKLKEILPLIIPNISKPEGLIQEVATIKTLAENFETAVSSCNRCKSVIEGIKNLGPITDQIRNIEAQVNDVSFVTAVEREFMSGVQMVKQLRATFEEAEGEWARAKAEYDALKICPLCNSSLTTGQ